MIFGVSINLGVFPEKLKLAKVTPIFRSGKDELLTNNRPMSAFAVFSKDTIPRY